MLHETVDEHFTTYNAHMERGLAPVSCINSISQLQLESTASALTANDPLVDLPPTGDTFREVKLFFLSVLSSIAPHMSQSSGLWNHPFPIAS